MTPSQDPANGASVPATVWTLVRAAAAKDPVPLAQLLRTYQPWLVVHLVLKHKEQQADAEDVVQNFLMQKVLHGTLLQDANPKAGRFRGLLLKSLNNFYFSSCRARKARKRAADHAGPLPEDEHLAGLSAEDEHTANVAWAVDLLAEALRQFREGCQTERRPELWGLFEGRSLAPAFGVNPVPFEQLARRWNLDSAKHASKLYAIAGKKFSRILEGVLLQHGEGSLEVERGHFLRDLRAAGPELLESMRTFLWGQLPEMTAMGPVPGRFDPLRLAELMDSTLPGPPDLAAVLREVLSAPLLDVLEVEKELLVHSLGDLLRHPAPGVDLLRIVKQFAKDNVRPDSDLPHPVATWLYYASIAGALVRHGVRISNLEDGAMRDGFGWARNQSWVEEEWRTLFREAIAAVA